MNKENIHILFSCSHDELLQATYTLTEHSLLKASNDEALPAESIHALKALEDQNFLGELTFLNAVKKQIGKEHTEEYQKLLLKYIERHPLPLWETLHEWGYTTDFVDELIPEKLEECHILVLGAPRDDLRQGEKEAILQFVRKGGGLLLLCNSEMLMNPLRHKYLHALTAALGIELQEYHNYPPMYIQVFQPHYITANVEKLQVQNVASTKITGRDVYPIAFTKATREPVAACGKFGSGRITAIGDAAIFSDSLLDAEQNTIFVKNTFCWLSACNAIDIQKFHATRTVNLGEEGSVEITLRNNHRHPSVRPDIECILASQRGTLIEPVRQEIPLVPQGKETLVKWGTVRPQKLGRQQLRFIINISHSDESQSLCFDRVPEEQEMYCLAPGYLTLEIRAKEGDVKTTVREGDLNLKTSVKTGEYFTIEGAFHWTSDAKHADDYTLELELAHGLIKTGEEIERSGKSVWYVKAVAPGTHKVALTIAETGQELPALISVASSSNDQIAELRAAYLYPLDAEIAERLRQVDERLSAPEIKERPFEIVPPEDFVRAIYNQGKMTSWLQEVLLSANREQWFNPELVDLVLTYIRPTYFADVGSFIPYDPHLASHLAELHPSDKKYLEYNLLWAESDDKIHENMYIKQNIAAYLLHEKYGHGFFYTQTRLGQQLAILLRHGFPDNPHEKHSEREKKAAAFIKDSAFVVNEGFAAWMELSFLEKLGREVQQAVYPRRVYLIREATGLYQRKGEFFEKYPPRYDSPFREGFECLEFIGKKFVLRCAIRLFLFVTQIELGITEDVQGRIQCSPGLDELKKRLETTNELAWCSHMRLQKVADLLYERRNEAITRVRNHNCPAECRKGACPLETFIAEHVQWGELL